MRRAPGLPALLLLVGGCAATGTGKTSPAPPTTTAATITMTPTPLRFELDRTVWTEQNVGASNKPGILSVRVFSRAKAAPDTQCAAALVVVAETVPANLDVAEYSVQKRTGMPPNVVESVFSHRDGTIQLENAIGYRMRGKQGCQPFVYTVHARDADVGYWILEEVDPHDHAVIEPEVRALFRSFRLARDGR